MAEEGNIDFWRKVKPGDNATLSDAVTIKRKLAAGKGPTPETYTISSSLLIENKAAEWRLFQLDEKNGLWLLAKIVDNNLALAVYDENLEWEPATRREILGTPRDFIFAPPADLDPQKGFVGDPNSLKYVGDITHEYGEGVKTTYLLKGQGEQTGTVTFKPLRTGVNDWIATVVEYSAPPVAEDPELLLLEIGSQDSGVIKMFTGRPLAVSDVNAMPR
jgi:hypothetical protein